MSTQRRGFSRLLGKVLLGLLKNLLFSIPISAVIAVIVWFVSDVLFGYQVGFLNEWRWSFIVWAGLTTLYKLYLSFHFLLACYLFARRFQVTMPVIAEAVIDYRMLQEDRQVVLSWNPEEFNQWLSSQRIGEMLGDSFYKAMFGGRR